MRSSDSLSPNFPCIRNWGTRVSNTVVSTSDFTRFHLWLTNAKSGDEIRVRAANKGGKNTFPCF